MFYVPAYTHERRSWSTILYPTSFTLESLLPLVTCAQRKTYGWCSNPGPMSGGDFLGKQGNIFGYSWDTCLLGVERVGGRNHDTNVTARCSVKWWRRDPWV